MPAAVQLFLATLAVLAVVLVVGAVAPRWRAIGRYALLVWLGLKAVVSVASAGWTWFELNAAVRPSRLLRTGPATVYRRRERAFRWAALLGFYAGVYAAAAFAPPPLGVAALAAGLWMVYAVNRAWVWNEKERSKIAKKIDPVVASHDPIAEHDLELESAGPPAVSNKARNWYAPTPPAGGRQTDLTDRLLARLRLMPDLLWFAVFAALQLFAVLPLLIVLVHDNFAQLFNTASHVSYGDCLVYILDENYLGWLHKAFGVRPLTDVELLPGATNLLSAVRYIVYILVIAAGYRVLQIYEDVREGVEGARQNPDTAVLLGRRAVEGLLQLVRDGTQPGPVRENALLALGRVRDLNGLVVQELTAYATGTAAQLRPAGVAAHEYETARLRAAATLALGYLVSSLPDPRPKAAVRWPVPPHLRDEYGAIADTLGRLLKKAEPVEVVRESATIALGLIDHPKAAAHLLGRLAEIQSAASDHSPEAHPEVVKHLAQSVGERCGTRWRAATPPDARTPAKGESGEDPAANAKRAFALIMHADGAVTGDGQLAHQGPNSLLRHRYLRVRNRAVTALAELGDPAALPAMLDALNQNDNPKLLVAWVSALKELVKVVPAGAKDLRDAARELEVLAGRVENGAVWLALAEALAEVAKRDRAAVGASGVDALARLLEEAYLQDDRDSQEPLKKLLKEPFGATERAERVEAEFSFDKLAGLVEVVTDAGRPEDERVTAARRLQPLKDAASLARLRRLLDSGAPPALRGPVGHVVELMGQVIAGTLEPRDAVRQLRDRRGP